tara:strand:+ start:576 stop:830 length:255 start_codon:yes stop_codon:yes gene_type:complete
MSSKYSYQINYKDGCTSLSFNQHRTIAWAKAMYLRKITTMIKEDLDDIDEVVLYKGNKIHSFRDINFKIDISKPADLHNVMFGL